MQTKKMAFGRARATIALLAASTAWLAVPARAQEAASTAAAAPHAKLGAWGFDLDGRDLSVKPGNDFQKYASGTWLKNTQIAADKPEAGASTNSTTSARQLKELITNAPEGSKAGALYQSMMDEARVEALGLRPLKADLAKIAAIKTKAEMAHYMGTTDGHFGSSLFGLRPAARHGGRDDERAEPLSGRARPAEPRLLSEARVQEAARRLPRLSRADVQRSEPEPGRCRRSCDGVRDSDREGQLAERGPPRHRQDQQPDERAELAKYAPGFQWAAYFAGAKIPAQKRMNVNENTRSADLPRSTPRPRCRR